MVSSNAAPSESWSEGDIDAGDVRVHFYRAGSTAHRPVVLVHGFSDNGLCWSRVTRTLEDSHDVVMLDARNHGLSQTAPGGLSELAADIVDRGVMLTGGGALLGDLDLALREQTGLAVSIADESLNCVALGTGKALEYEKQLRHAIDYDS